MRTHQFRVSILLTASLLSACITRSDQSGVSYSTNAEQAEIAQAVLKYFTSDGTYPFGEKRSFKFYLSVAGKDPSKDLLEKIARTTGVLYLAQSRLPPKPDAFSFPRDSMLVSVSEFEIIQLDIAKGSVGYFCGNLCASGKQLIVRKVDGMWTVESITSEIFS